MRKLLDFLVQLRALSPYPCEWEGPRSLASPVVLSRLDFSSMNVANGDTAILQVGSITKVFAASNTDTGEIVNDPLDDMLIPAGTLLRVMGDGSATNSASTSHWWLASLSEVVPKPSTGPLALGCASGLGLLRQRCSIGVVAG